MFLSRLFRSRWAALLWASGIVWTAADVATGMPAAPAEMAAATNATDAAGAPVNAADLAALASAGG